MELIIPVTVYLEKRASKKTEENAIRVQLSVKGVTLQSTIGHSINPDNWREGQVKPKSSVNKKGGSATKINADLDKIKAHFSPWEMELTEKPSKEDVKKHLKLALEVKVEKGPIPAKVKKVGLFTRLEEFIKEESAANSWAYATLQVWKTFTHHMQGFNPKVTFEFFNESGINKWVIYLRSKGLEEKSVQKHFNNLRWFLYWALRKNYTKEDTIKRYRPKLKVLEKPVIFLTKEELIHLYHFEVPGNGSVVKLKDMNGEEYEKTVEDAGGLIKTRDLFCFCAFTSLRYSDMANLKKTDIEDDTMYITTMKTYDRLPINLNKFAKEILKKYEHCNFPGGLALPVIPNQLMNRYLKHLCELAGFNKPITRTCYRGGERVEETFPKYEMISTHAGRRTFICFALSSGIPPQVVMKWTGHSDYQAMKPYIDIAEKTKANAMALFESELSK